MIKELELEGFKSFRRKVKFRFFPGLTCICGPNGSGKSNLFDAILFALGIIPSEALRAEKLKELLYHGNKSSSEAKVTLILDGNPGMSISRRITSKGTSAYKLNGKLATREKVLEMLSAFGLNPRGYNLVKQGEIERLIDATPKQRKELIDEIAGIKEYDSKKQKALKQLEEVETKLKEIEPRLKAKLELLAGFEQEIAKIEKYERLKQELKNLKASSLSMEIQGLRQDLEKLELGIKCKEAKIQQFMQKAEELEKIVEEKEKRLEELAKKSMYRKEAQGLVEIELKLARKEQELETKLKELKRIMELVERIGPKARSIQALLGLKLKGVYGTPNQLAKVPEELLIPFKVALGNLEKSLIVENEDVASVCIDYLKREKLGRLAFIPLNRIKPKKLKETQKMFLSHEGILGRLLDFIEIEKKFKPAFEFLLGDTILIENLETAKRIGIGKLRMVTLAGELMERSGLMIGGYPEVKQEISKEVEEEMKSEIKTIKKEIDELKALLEAKRKVKPKEEVERETLLTEIRKLRSEIKISYSQAISLREDVNRLKINKTRIETKLESLELEIKEFKGYHRVELPLAHLRERLRTVEFELKNLGSLNFKAKEEYEKLKPVVEELKKKYEQIMAEKKAILDMIQEIEKKRKETFERCLIGINHHFSEIFNRLTQGEAWLELEEPGNLDSGVSIKVNLAGKKVRNLDALSGGEKALTALTLILAIQRYKPAPFYLFDEVDAMLDEKNSKRVADLLKEFSKSSQFIMITHNKAVLKQADHIYGITLVNGESQVLSLKP